MTDCSNIDVREALPDHLHGILDDATRERVEMHLACCQNCMAEWHLLCAVLASMPTPQVDVAQIAAAVPPYRRQTRVHIASLRLAAAVLVAVTGVSMLSVTHPRPSQQVSGLQGASEESARATAPAGIALIGVGELSDDGLEQLIAEMDHLEATPPTDPDPMLPTTAEGGV